MGLWGRIRGSHTDAVDKHFRLIDRATEVTSASLVCHEDTWSVLTQVPAFRLDELATDRITHLEGRLVQVELSGPLLVNVLDVTAAYDRYTSRLRSKRLHKPDGALDLAKRLRAAIAAALEGVGPEGNGPIPTIRLDEPAVTEQ